MKLGRISKDMYKGNGLSCSGRVFLKKLTVVDFKSRLKPHNTLSNHLTAASHYLPYNLSKCVSSLS